MDKIAAGFQANDREEQYDPQLPQREVGAWRHKPVQLADTADTPEDQRHNQRTARQPQFQRGRESWHKDGNRT